MFKYMNLWKLWNAEGETGAAESVETNKEGQEQGEKTFTQAELNKILQERLDREAKASEKRTAEAVKQALEEAKLTAEEKAAKEQERALKAMEAREAEIRKRETRLKAVELLSEKKLPGGLIDLVNLDGEEACSASIEAIEKTFSASLQAAVNERLKGSTPPAGKPNSGDAMEKFREAMGLPSKKKE